MFLNKINDQFKFRKIRDFHVQQIADIISRYDSEWYIDTTRQDHSKLLAGVHQMTVSYKLITHRLQWCPGDSYSPVFVCKDEQLWTYVEPIIKNLETIYSGKVSRATLVNLPSNKLVFPHHDYFVYPNLVHRIHIPIITNDNVFFSVDDVTKNLKMGQAWEVNNARLHGCYNLGDTDRVHLMIDIIPEHLIGNNEIICLDDENVKEDEKNIIT